MTAAEVAVPSQRHDAAGAAIAVVASDLIDDDTWLYYTDTPLWKALGFDRSGGVLAERCTCGYQLGERLYAASLGIRSEPTDLPACRCPTPSLPTIAAVETALALVRRWTLTWEELVQFAARVGQNR